MLKNQRQEDLNDKSHRLLFRFLKVAWIISVFFVSYLSLTPQVELPIEFMGIDKVCHLLGYFWLAALPFFAFQRFKISLTMACLVFLLGIGLEFAQDFVPGRFFSVADMIANNTGVVLGVFFGGFLMPRFWVRLQS